MAVVVSNMNKEGPSLVFLELLGGWETMADKRETLPRLVMPLWNWWQNPWIWCGKIRWGNRVKRWSYLPWVPHKNFLTLALIMYKVITNVGAISTSRDFKQNSSPLLPIFISLWRTTCKSQQYTLHCKKAGQMQCWFKKVYLNLFALRDLILLHPFETSPVFNDPPL